MTVCFCTESEDTIERHQYLRNVKNTCKIAWLRKLHVSFFKGFHSKKSLFPRWHFIYKLKNVSSLNGRNSNYFPNQEKQNWKKIQDFVIKWKINIQLIIFFLHILWSFSLWLLYSFRNEEKLALLVYTLFRRRTASSIRNSFVATSAIGWIKPTVLNWV